MRFSTKAMTGLAVGVAVLASLTACSTSSTPSGGSTTPAAEEGTFASGDPGTLVFATVPDKAGTDAAWKPLEDYIAKKTGLEVEFHATTDYDALIAAAVAGQVDVGAFSGATYLKSLYKGADLDFVTAVSTSADYDTPGYYSEAIVPAGSSIKDVKDFAGKKVCFVSNSSTSGFFIPMATLQNAGIDVTSTGTDASGNPQFSAFTAVFAGAHDKSVQAVASGQCDVGFAEDAAAEASGSGVDVISKTLVPGGPIVVSAALPQSIKDELTDILGNITIDDITAEGIPVTDDFKSAFAYTEVVDPKEFYADVQWVCDNIAAAKCGKAGA